MAGMETRTDNIEPDSQQMKTVRSFVDEFTELLADYMRAEARLKQFCIDNSDLGAWQCRATLEKLGLAADQVVR